MKSFLRPHPEARHYSNHQNHHILDHVDGEIRRRRLLEMDSSDRTGEVPSLGEDFIPAGGVLPLQHPGREVVLLVEHARHDDDGGDRVQHGEHADTQDKLLKLVSLGAVLLHHCSDSYEGDETSYEE